MVSLAHIYRVCPLYSSSFIVHPHCIFMSVHYVQIPPLCLSVFLSLSLSLSLSLFLSVSVSLSLSLSLPPSAAPRMEKGLLCLKTLFCPQWNRSKYMEHKRRLCSDGRWQLRWGQPSILQGSPPSCALCFTYGLHNGQNHNSQGFPQKLDNVFTKPTQCSLNWWKGLVYINWQGFPHTVPQRHDLIYRILPKRQKRVFL